MPRPTISQKQFDKLAKAAQPDCSGCAVLLDALKPFVRKSAGRPSIGEGGKPLTNTEKVRRYRAKLRAEKLLAEKQTNKQTNTKRKRTQEST